MKHKLNYTVEVDSKLTTLFIFFHSQNPIEKAGSMALEVEIFMPCIYNLAAESFVFV